MFPKKKIWSKKLIFSIINDLELVNDSVRQNQVIEKEIDNQISKAVRSEVMTAKNCMYDTVLTAIYNHNSKS